MFRSFTRSLTIAAGILFALLPPVVDNPFYPLGSRLGEYHDAVWALHAIPASIATYVGGFRGGLAFAIVSSAAVFGVEQAEAWSGKSDAERGAHGETIHQYVVIFVTVFNLVTAFAMGNLVRQLRAEETALRQANADLAEVALRDPLTGLYNRRFLTEHLQRTLSRARRNGDSVTVIMIDFDRLKQINDTWGHRAGDRALRAVAEMIQSQVRHEDVVCRYGGDEFAVVLSCTAPAEALQLVDRLLAEVRRRPVALAPDAPAVTLAFSAGVASFPEHADSVDGIFQQADAAMYAAKREGTGIRLAAAAKPEGDPTP